MKKIKNLLFAALLLALFGNFSANAQKLLPRPPLFGIPAKTLPQNHWVIRGYWIYDNYTTMWNKTENKMTDIPSSISFKTNIVWGKIRYGITNNLTFILNVPYVNKSMVKNGVTKSGVGLGDVIGALLYKFYHNKKDRFLLSGLLFTKSPTGKVNNLTADELPLGTGSFDYGLAILPEKEFGKWDMRWSAFYLKRGKNNDDVDLGNVVSLEWSTAYNFSKKLIFENSLYYKRAFENSKNGTNIENSDSYVFQIIPAVQYRFGNSFFVQVVVPFNIYQKRTFGNAYETWLGLYYMF